MALTIVTYGGGEVLQNTFNAVAMLMNRQSGDLVRPLMVITASLGAVWAVGRALFSGGGESLVSRYLLPLIIIMGLLCVPTSTVRIEDVLKGQSYSVAHVPMILARFAELVSSIGYKITTAMERVMHVPRDTSYNATGMIFGADSALSLRKLEIRDAALEQNLRRFCKQCVLYDLALGRYSLDELKKSSDLWEFFEGRTSSVRMIPYEVLGTSVGEATTSYLNCKEAISKMAPYFQKERDFQAKQEVVKHLPLSFQALTSLRKDREELIAQLLMMQVLRDEYSGDRFAVDRAHSQQRSTYFVLGELASKSLVVMRVVLEALIYAAFLLVVPLSLLPGGLKTLMSWAWLCVWIQLWPPFYSILNYVMQTVAHSHSSPIFEGLADSQMGLSLFTSVGLKNLQEDIYALAGYLSASIPFLSYAVLKGGVSSFIHLAGSMMTPAHAASTSAASEQATGSYSLANANFGQTSYGNSSAFQSNLAPTLSSGFMVDNRGASSMLYAGEEAILKQSNSELRTSIFGDRSASESAHQAQQYALSLSEQQQKSYSESLAQHGREFTEFSEHLGKSTSFQEGSSYRESQDIQESARYLEHFAASWGEQYSLPKRQSMEILAAAGGSGGGGINLGVVKFGAQTEARIANAHGASREDILSSALNASKSQDFQTHYQTLANASQSQTFSAGDDQGARLASSLSQSIDQVRSAQESHQYATNVLDQFSQATSSTNQQSLQVRAALNQDFINWASSTYAEQGGFSWVGDVVTKGSTVEKNGLIRSFVDHVAQNAKMPSLGDQPSFDARPGISLGLPGSPSDIARSRLQQDYEGASLESVDETRFSVGVDGIARKAAARGIAKDGERDGRHLEGLTAGVKRRVSGAASSARENIDEQGEGLSGHLEKREKEGLTKRAVKGKSKALVGSYSTMGPPLWLQKD